MIIRIDDRVNQRAGTCMESSLAARRISQGTNRMLCEHSKVSGTEEFGTTSFSWFSTISLLLELNRLGESCESLSEAGICSRPVILREIVRTREPGEAASWLLLGEGKEQVL